MKLSMTDDEIRISYRDALDKTNQLKILCHLNCCHEERICDILNIGYENIPSHGARIRAINAKLNHDNFLKHYKKGLCDSQIATVTGMSRSTVTAWRLDMGLAPVKQPQKNRKYVNKP